MAMIGIVIFIAPATSTLKNGKKANLWFTKYHIKVSIPDVPSRTKSVYLVTAVVTLFRVYLEAVV